MIDRLKNIRTVRVSGVHGRLQRCDTLEPITILASTRLKDVLSSLSAHRRYFCYSFYIFLVSACFLSWFPWLYLYIGLLHFVLSQPGFSVCIYCLTVYSSFLFFFFFSFPSRVLFTYFNFVSCALHQTTFLVLLPSHIATTILSSESSTSLFLLSITFSIVSYFSLAPCIGLN